MLVGMLHPENQLGVISLPLYSVNLQLLLIEKQDQLLLLSSVKHDIVNKRNCATQIQLYICIKYQNMVDY